MVLCAQRNEVSSGIAKDTYVQLFESFAIIAGFLFFSSDADYSGGTITLCNLKPHAGFCEAYFPKYYFDTNEGKCMKFIWGGCGGGVVPFDTLDECSFVCE